MRLRATARDVVDGFAKHRVLTYASAIAYQVLGAVIPFALFALALAGTVGAESLWSHHLRPDIRASASSDVFNLVDNTVQQILHHKQVFWVTFGLLLVLWELGGALRATMEALDGIYGVRRKRSRTDKYLTSTWLAAAVGALWLVALVLLASGGALLDGPLGAVARYAVAAVVLMVATGLVLRVAPATRQPLRWVSLGSVVIVVGSLLVVGGYVLYATHVASYSSVFGSLAAVFVLLVAVFLAAVVFLAGVLIDAAARERA